MKRKVSGSSLWFIGFHVCAVLLTSSHAQIVAPALVNETKIIASAGSPTNVTCESFGNPINLCIWERFSPDRTKSSTVVSYMEGASNASDSLPGFYLTGDLKSGVCTIYKPNISRVDTSSWQCTLFTNSQVYRENVHVDVVNKPDPPRFIPAELEDLVDGETVGHTGAPLTCYSSYGLPPPTFKWFLGDEPYEGELLPVNSTEDGEGNIYTFQQLRNQQFSWKDNGKKLRCVIIHDMIDEDDIKEVAVPITVRFKPRSEQNSVTLYVPELGKELTNLTYTFYANPKPRIFWDIDGVAISAGFSTNDRRVEALQLEQAGPSKWQATLKVRSINRSDLRHRYVLKSENAIGKQEFEICLTLNPSLQGVKCNNQALFLQVRPSKPPPSQAQSGFGEEEVPGEEDFRSGYDGNQREYALKEKLRTLHRQMQSLRDQEARLKVQLQRMKKPRIMEEPVQDLAANTSSTVFVPASSSFVIGAEGPNHSEVQVESAGIYIRKKPPTSVPATS